MDELKNILNVYYSTFFYDNKEVIGFLENIDSDGGNNFDIITKKLLAHNSSTDNDFLAKNDTYYDMLASIIISSSVILDICENNNNYFSIYQSVEQIILSKDEPLETDVSKVKVVSEINNYNKTKYMFKGDQLHIYDDKLIGLEFTKKNYIYQGENNIDDKAILSNYLMFLFSFKDYNFKLQTLSFTIIFIVILLCYSFQSVSEYIIKNGSSVKSCEHIVKLFEDMDQFKNQLKYMLQNTGDTSSYNNINTKCINECPVSLSILDKEIIVDKTYIFQDDYVVNIGSKTYEIVSVNYDDIEDNPTQRLLSSIVLKGVGSESKCPNNRSYPYINVKMDDMLDITIRSKNLIDMKHTYIKNGNILKKLNSKIEKSKNSINKMAKENDKQVDIIKNIDIRMYIYYGIFAVIIMAYIIMIIITLDNSLKLNIAGGILIVIGIMNIANYFLNYSYIENFSNYVNDGQCALLNTNTSVNDRVEYINKTNGLYKTHLTDILSQSRTLLSSLDSSDFYKTISGSLKNEVKAFTDYDNVYKYKADIDKKSIDIMKHEMIDKTAFINFLSVSFLIIATIFVIHTYIDNNNFVKAYAVIIALLVFFNLYIYYYKILHPVRTRARYNYWYKPSDSVQRNMS